MLNLSRRLRAFLPALLLIAAPLFAQDGVQAPVEYPTLAALANVEIPPSDRVELAKTLLGVASVEPPPSVAPPHKLEERATFNVTNSAEDQTFQVEAALRGIGEHIYLWVEDGAEVSDGELQALAQAFDERVYPDVRNLWGSEAIPGIDGDPRVYGLFAHGLGAGTGAYFVSEHTYPVEAVSTSNEHEMFFFNLDYMAASPDLRMVESILAHEFQHMIRHHLQSNEECWINEGFSEFTQLYLYGVPMWEILSFLNTPETQLNTWSEEIGGRAQNYGAAALFVTYFYDRYGLAALQRLSADPQTRALDAVDTTLRAMGEPGVNDLFADWVLANALFDTRVNDGFYGYRSITNGIMSAVPLETITEYPAARDHMVNQYATDYYVLTNLEDAGSLDIRVQAPATVQLVPADAYSGQRMWYSNRADMSSLTLTRAFDLTGVTEATLSYQVWFHTEQYWDFGYVMVSNNDGKTWDILETPHTTSDNPHNTAYGPGYTGDSEGWQAESVSLDDYAGQQVLVRFHLITDDTVTRPGILIDDVGIPEIGYFDDFESSPGGWEAQGWVWIDNILPQQVWVQAVQQIGNQAVVSRWLAPLDSEWILPLEQNVDQVLLAISPFAPVTTVPMPYTLDVAQH
jgi:immune inhibitor A